MPKSPHPAQGAGIFLSGRQITMGNAVLSFLPAPAAQDQFLELLELCRKSIFSRDFYLDFFCGKEVFSKFKDFVQNIKKPLWMVCKLLILNP